MTHRRTPQQLDALVQLVKTGGHLIHPSKERFHDDIEVFELAIAQIRNGREQNPNASYAWWDKAIERLEAFKQGCAGLDPTAYRECVEALKLVIKEPCDNGCPLRDEVYDKLQQVLRHAEGQPSEGKETP